MVSEVLALPEVQDKPAMPARKKVAGKETGADRYQKLKKLSQNGESAYLTGKGLQGYSLPLLTAAINLAGMTFPAGSLLLPLTDITGNVTGGQLINSDGDKVFYPAVSCQVLLLPWLMFRLMLQNRSLSLKDMPLR
jgi:putative DNA primase/helicase